MNLFANAEVKIVEKQSFTDEGGTTVEYFVNYIKNDEGEVLELNSKNDYTEFEGKTGVVKIRARKQETRGFKLTMVGFVEGDVIGSDAEDTVIE